MQSTKANTRKRLAALAATGLLAMGLGLGAGPALAQTTTGTDFSSDVSDSTVTFSNVASGDTVTAYRIADAYINTSNEVAYTWTTGLPSDYDSVDELTAVESNSETAKTAADALAANLVSNTNITSANGGIVSATAGDSGATLTLDSGYWLVLATTTSGATKVYQATLVPLVPQASTNNTYAASSTASVSLKSQDVTAPSKVILGEADNSGNQAESESSDGYSVGDTVTFRVSGAIPSYPSNATYVTYKVIDTPDKGLAISTDTFQVKMNGSTSSLTRGTDYTASVDSTTGVLTVTFSNPKSLAGQSYTITYTATVSSVSDTNGTVGNSAKATFNPNPYVDQTVDTLTDTTTLTTYGLVFQKVSGTTAEGVTTYTALPGATFALYNADGTTAITRSGTALTSTSDANGYVYFSGLEAGTYTLKETSAPAGYQTVADFTVELSSTSATHDNPATSGTTESNYAIALNSPTSQVGEASDTEGTVTAAKIQDPAQGELPSTGGPGTIALTAGGVVLVVGGAYIVRRARRREDD